MSLNQDLYSSSKAGAPSNSTFSSLTVDAEIQHGELGHVVGGIPAAVIRVVDATGRHGDARRQENVVDSAAEIGQGGPDGRKVAPPCPAMLSAPQKIYATSFQNLSFQPRLQDAHARIIRRGAKVLHAASF